MKKLTTNEIVLQFLIDKYHTQNRTTMTQDDVNKLHLSEQEVIHAFHLLQSDGYLKITRPNNEDNFDKFWEFELKPDGVRYFEKKHKEHKLKTQNLLKWLIPTLIACAEFIIICLQWLEPHC